ncbi:hypothetical protein PVAND_000163 [Polypedilum vanderplanki]|uniref:RlpA-like protein double-psi beta-barrel domain-containing protein n=1 Tax=Polypedilum vanderplanki TaxID=319348 RepID=A0A9J6BJI9_POLVA|nr:hypothetical protein PVAND_000163 [Polypedilum vanderplanki]
MDPILISQGHMSHNYRANFYNKLNHPKKFTFVCLALFTILSIVNAYSGDLTYYTSWRGNFGSCGLERSKWDAFYVAALSRARMSGSANPNKHPLCAANKCIKINGARGSVVVKISDTCGACKYDDVDIADTVFPLLDDPKKGRVKVTWDFTDCSRIGKV